MSVKTLVKECQLFCIVQMLKRSTDLVENVYSRTSVADGSFTSAPSNSFLSPHNKTNPIAADIIVFGIISGDFLFYINNGMLCVIIRIASMRRFQ